MNEQLYEKASTVFLEIVEHDEADRELLLAELCGGDEEVRGEVCALLDAYENTPSALRGSALDLLMEMPERVGRYIVLEKLGEGGMGVVYRARQEEPRRAVALKLIRSPFSTDAMRRRFADEVQVLGQLNHPGIAQIYEASLEPRDDGDLPYFAMELVEGEGLDRFVRSREIDVRGRLRLMIRICEAVRHAHQKGVLHRDLKPSNILVTEDGKPKVLDFGIARSVEIESEGAFGGTGAGGFIGTPRYMSPEQVTMAPEALDFRSDVYALGVVGFELVCGMPPYEVDTEDPDAARQAITTAAPRPLKLTGPGASRHLTRELEAVFAKALAKDRDQRYESASALALDLRRCLEHRPTEVRPGGGWHQLKLLGRRNPVAAVLSVVAVLSLVAGMVVSNREAAIATQQRNEARSATGRAEAATARAATSAAEARAATAETLYSLGRMASHRGDWQGALTNYEQARRFGYPAEVMLRIGEAEAWNGLFQHVKTRRALTELASREDLGSYRAAVTLMRGLFGVTDPERPGVGPLDLVRQALKEAETDRAAGAEEARGLTASAAWLARAFLAEDFAAMRRRLERSLDERAGLEDAPFRDAFYRLALVDLVPLLLVLGEFDEAEAKVDTLRSVLPNDPTADLLAGGIAIFEGDAAGSKQQARRLLDAGYPAAAGFLAGASDLLIPRLQGFQNSWMDEFFREDKKSDGSLLSDLVELSRDIFRLLPYVMTSPGDEEGGGAGLGVVLSAVPPAFSRIIGVTVSDMVGSIIQPANRTPGSMTLEKNQEIAETFVRVLPIGASFFVRGRLFMETKHYAAAIRDFTMAAHTPSPVRIDRAARFSLAHTLALQYRQRSRSDPDAARGAAASAARVIRGCLARDRPNVRELRLLCATALRIRDAGLVEMIAGRWWHESHEPEARVVQLKAAEAMGSRDRLEALARELQEYDPDNPAARRFLDR